MKVIQRTMTAGSAHWIQGTGRLGRDAGWIGYFIDSVGVAAFGSWWAYAAWAGIGISVIILLGLLAYSLQTLLTPVRWVTTMLGYAWRPISCCCLRGGSDDTPLPEGPPLARHVEWRGPATGWPAETRYLQEKVKGRGSRRRLNDVLVRVGGQVARLQQDESSQRRIDMHGLKVKFLSITGCTSRQFRRELEDIGEMRRLGRWRWSMRPAEALQKLMSRYLKEPPGTRDSRTTDLCLQLLHELRPHEEARAPDAEDVRRRITERTPNRPRAPAGRHEDERTSPPEPHPFPPGLGGESLFSRQDDRGALVRPSGQEGKANPLLQGDAIVNQLFGGSDRTRRQNEDGTVKAGAVQAGGGDAEVGARMIHVLEGIKKATEGERRTAPGTKSYIGPEESLDLYLARGCNTLTVEVCPDTTGKDLFDGLKRACGHSKHLLQSIGWPCLMTNGIAYGLAAMCHGGRDHTTLPNWTLSVAQAVTATPKDFDNYEMPKDDKVETKPRHPTHFATWLKQARNEIKMLGSVIGLEHRSGRLRALEQIEQAHEADRGVLLLALGGVEGGLGRGAEGRAQETMQGTQLWAAPQGRPTVRGFGPRQRLHLSDDLWPWWSPRILPEGMRAKATEGDQVDHLRPAPPQEACPRQGWREPGDR